MENNNILVKELQRARHSKIPDSLRVRFRTVVIPSLSGERPSVSWILSIRFVSLACIALLLLGSTMAVAARESEPGELLYPVKSFIERVAPEPMKPLIQKPAVPTETPTQTPEPEHAEEKQEEPYDNDTHDDADDDTRTETTFDRIASPSSRIVPEREIDKKSQNESKQNEQIHLDTIVNIDNGKKKDDDENEHEDEQENETEEISPEPTSTPSHILPIHVSIDIPPVQIKL
ncbi:MAG: hypothetical protein NUV98_03280 [Candidatus Roizmanbacteria bacterium]|nr:hypothetical protein [Candidatus Roizmanbacteria bacterium]